MVGNTFCPRGWAEANGQLLPISSNTALFSLYGTTYGGDGRTTFALPDLRGRAPVHTGQAPGSDREWRQGMRTSSAVAESGSNGGSVTVPGATTLRFCVALQGIFPSRN